jgi:hypothetical protein
LVAQTNYGRPNWDKEFTNIKQSEVGKDIGVIFCGPDELSKVLHQHCNDFSDDKTTFLYRKESF